MLPTSIILTFLLVISVILISTKLRIDVGGISEISGALILDRLSYSCFISYRGISYGYFSSSVILVISTLVEIIYVTSSVSFS